jgi:predicted DNA-binding transcriptional regulator YafY
LENAIRGFDELVLSYRKIGEPRRYLQKVKPLGLLFGRFGYLVALASAKGIRTYRLNLIESVEPTGKTFTPPRWFNLKEWAAESFGIYHGDELKTWRIVFSPKVADRAESVRFHHSEQKRRLSDGSLEVKLRCRGEQELLWELAHPDWQGDVAIY